MLKNRLLLSYFGQHLIAVTTLRQATVQLSVKLAIISIDTKSTFSNTKTSTNSATTFNLDTGTLSGSARRICRCKTRNFCNSSDIAGGKNSVSPSPEQSSCPALQL